MILICAMSLSGIKSMFQRSIREKMQTLVLCILATGFFGTTGNAQIIYTNSFGGSQANIWGTAPDSVSNQFGGTNTAMWNDALGFNDTSAFYANGYVGTGQGDSIL